MATTRTFRDDNTEGYSDRQLARANELADERCAGINSYWDADQIDAIHEEILRGVEVETYRQTPDINGHVWYGIRRSNSTAVYGHGSAAQAHAFALALDEINGIDGIDYDLYQVNEVSQAVADRLESSQEGCTLAEELAWLAEVEG